MKIVSTVINVVEKNKDVITASELDREDPENAEEIIAQYEQKSNEST